MIFFVLTDLGLETQPLIASNLASAADILRLRYGNGLNGDNITPVNVALILPQQIAAVTPDGSGDPTKATLVTSGDGATQATLRQNAQNALANNAAFLGIVNPTNAQAVAQVQALTRQMDAVIRMLIGNFSGTT